MKTKQRIKIYDNEGATFDRYTAIYLDMEYIGELVQSLGMTDAPFHPQGFCQHSGAWDGPHLGKRIKLADLPEDCRKAVQSDLEEFEIEEVWP